MNIKKSIALKISLCMCLSLDFFLKLSFLTFKIVDCIDNPISHTTSLLCVFIQRSHTPQSLRYDYTSPHEALHTECLPPISARSSHSNGIFMTHGYDIGEGSLLNKQIRSQITELQRKLRCYENDHDGDFTKTLLENERLRDENKRLHVELARARLTSSTPKVSVSSSSSDVRELSDEDDLMDAELERLIMRNEASLKELRQDLHEIRESEVSIGPENSVSPVGGEDDSSSAKSPSASFYEGVLSRKQKLREERRRRRKEGW